MWVEGSIRLSSRLSLSFPSNNRPLTTPLELDGGAQLRTECELMLTHNKNDNKGQVTKDCTKILYHQSGKKKTTTR